MTLVTLRIVDSEVAGGGSGSIALPGALDVKGKSSRDPGSRPHHENMPAEYLKRDTDRGDHAPETG